MTKRQLDRITRLLPNGEPQYVRIYDHGEENELRTVPSARYLHDIAISIPV